MNVKITWPVVAIIIAFLGSIVALSWLNKDTAALIAVGSLILGGMGFTIAQNQGIKEQTNGNTHNLQDTLKQMMEQQQRQLSEMQRVLAVSQPVHHDVLTTVTADSAKPISSPPALSELTVPIPGLADRLRERT